ncbi:MAG: hypothetical protein JOZ41_15255 [Chloroflexi bacterium]|nr:hypothetical protein [Chloroflexota bacterium]
MATIEITPRTAVEATNRNRNLSVAHAETASRLILQHRRRNPLVGRLYQYHGFRVVDVNGEQVGLVDWIWSDGTTGQGEFLGVQLQWLRGKARAVPALGLRIDRQTSTIRVAYAAEQVKNARRFSIDRPLTVEQKTAIYSHFELEPAIVPVLVGAEAAA